MPTSLRLPLPNLKDEVFRTVLEVIAEAGFEVAVEVEGSEGFSASSNSAWAWEFS